MNIFYLDSDPTECAKSHNDKHVVKMIVETAQLLSTAHRILDGKLVFVKGKRQYIMPDELEQVLYKVTHHNHPSSLWCRESSSNYTWLYELFVALCDEYSYRYGKVHMTDTKLRTVLAIPPKNTKHNKFTEPPTVMPDELVLGSTIESYRTYYKTHKSHIANWRGRGEPLWWSTMTNIIF